jgi:hypothetical protein
VNFTEAIAAHSDWKRKLTTYLRKPDSSIDPTVLEKNDQCLLGKWLEDEADRLSAFPDFAELVREHSAFHRAAADVVRKADRGEDVSADILLGAKSPFTVSSVKVVQILMRMDRVQQMAKY